jgi:hypothetical protein
MAWDQSSENAWRSEDGGFDSHQYDRFQVLIYSDAVVSDLIHRYAIKII